MRDSGSSAICSRMTPNVNPTVNPMMNPMIHLNRLAWICSVIGILLIVDPSAKRLTSLSHTIRGVGNFRAYMKYSL